MNIFFNEINKSRLVDQVQLVGLENADQVFNVKLDQVVQISFRGDNLLEPLNNDVRAGLEDLLVLMLNCVQV